MVSKNTNPRGPGGGSSNQEMHQTHRPPAAKNSGEEIVVRPKSGAVKDGVIDLRYNGLGLDVLTETGAIGAGVTLAADSGLHFASAAYVNDGGTIKRTYARPTQFVAGSVKTQDAADKATTSFAYLDEIHVVGKLVFLDATTGDTSTEGTTPDSTIQRGLNQKVKVTISDTHGRLTTPITQTIEVSDDSGEFDATFSDKDLLKLVPGPHAGYNKAGDPYDITVEHVPSGEQVWKAEDPPVLHLAVKPLSVGTSFYHASSNIANDAGSWKNPLEFHARTDPYPSPALWSKADSDRAAAPAGYGTAGHSAYTWMGIATADSDKLDVLDENGIVDEIRIHMKSLVGGVRSDGGPHHHGMDPANRDFVDIDRNPSGTVRAAMSWTDIGGHKGGGGGQNRAGFYGFWNTHKNDAIIKDEGIHLWTEGGLKGFGFITAAEQLDSRTIAVGFSPGGLKDITGNNNPLCRNHDQQYTFLFATVVDDTPDMRWVGGSFEYHGNSPVTDATPFRYGAWDPTYSPPSFQTTTDAHIAATHQSHTSTGGGGHGTSGAKRQHTKTCRAGGVSATGPYGTYAPNGRGGKWYSGAYSGRNWQTHVNLAGAPSSGVSKVVIRVGSSHTFAFAGAQISIAGHSVHIPYHGTATVTVTGNAAQTIANNGFTISGSGRGGYAYGPVSSIRATFTYTS